MITDSDQQFGFRTGAALEALPWHEDLLYTKGLTGEYMYVDQNVIKIYDRLWSLDIPNRYKSDLNVELLYL